MSDGEAFSYKKAPETKNEKKAAKIEKNIKTEKMKKQSKR